MTEVDIRSDIAKLYDSFYESMITEKEDDDVHFVMPYEDFYGLGMCGFNISLHKWYKLLNNVAFSLANSNIQ